MHAKVSCELLITGLCNMRCNYCCARELPPIAMTVDTARRSLDMFFALARGAEDVEITFTGGEPLLEFALLRELADYLKQKATAYEMGVRCILKTNGTILDDAVLGFMVEVCSQVVVSIDGCDLVHDQERRHIDGGGTHRAVSRNVLKMVQNGVPCAGALTVRPGSCRAVLEGVQHLHRLGLSRVDVAPAYGTVHWREEECQDLAGSLNAVAKYVRESNAVGNSLEVGPFYRDTEHVEGRLSARWGCHAGVTNLAFLPDGRIAGCSALAMLATKFPSLVLGDISDGLDQEAVDHLVRVSQADRSQRARCQKCVTATDCTGGCLAINYATTGLPFDPPSIYCRTIAAIPQAWRTAWAGTG